MSSQNWVNRPAASCGPGAASGWYWTLNAGASSSRRPSTTPSFRLTWLIRAGPHPVSNGVPSAALDVPAFTVQYHPEAAAGPHDADYLFGRFVELIERSK